MKRFYGLWAIVAFILISTNVYALELTKKPVIGITPDWDKGPSDTAIYPRYLIRTNYVSSVAKHGAAPILIPYGIDEIDSYIDLIDGLIITGGFYDIDPSWYGEQPEPGLKILKNNRAEFEMRLMRAALAKKIPILGICAGEQLLAVMHGGKLYQDIKSSQPAALEHLQERLDKTSHSIHIEKNSMLYQIVQKNKIEVNSAHHQAVKSIGSQMIVSARAPDGIIEAIELKNYPFALGLQWHPECETNEADSNILKAFVKAATAKI